MGVGQDDSPISANFFRSFASKLPQNRHPERSAHRFFA
jgi:hypothetical protein